MYIMYVCILFSGLRPLQPGYFDGKQRQQHYKMAIEKIFSKFVYRKIEKRKTTEEDKVESRKHLIVCVLV